jgi:hypothetical protein
MPLSKPPLAAPLDLTRLIEPGLDAAPDAVDTGSRELDETSGEQRSRKASTLHDRSLPQAKAAEVGV